MAVRKKIEDEDKTSNLGGSTNPMARDNDRFIASQQQTTHRMIEQQDASLDTLGVAVDRLHKIGKDIHEEVQEQNVLLDAFGNEVDDAGAKMDVVTASLAKLLKTKDGCQIWTIVVLTFILILLSKLAQSWIYMYLFINTVYLLHALYISLIFYFIYISIYILYLIYNIHYIKCDS